MKRQCAVGSLDAIAELLRDAPWNSLFERGVIEADDIHDPVDYVAEYYQTLRELLIASAEADAGWQLSVS